MSQKQFVDHVEHIVQQRRNNEKGFRIESPIYNQLTDMIHETYGDDSKRKGGLKQRDKILIALGNAVLSGTDSSIEWTVTRALNHGITREEIKDAVDVALLNGGGLTVSRARTALETLEHRINNMRRSDPHSKLDDLLQNP